MAEVDAFQTGVSEDEGRKGRSRGVELGQTGVAACEGDQSVSVGREGERTGWIVQVSSLVCARTNRKLVSNNLCEHLTE